MIDIHLAVGDAADEGAYARDLEEAGYRLIIREPDWYQHRLLKGEIEEIMQRALSA